MQNRKTFIVKTTEGVDERNTRSFDDLTEALKYIAENKTTFFSFRIKDKPEAPSLTIDTSAGPRVNVMGEDVDDGILSPTSPSSSPR